MSAPELMGAFLLMLVVQTVALLARDAVRTVLERRRAHREVIALTQRAMARFHEKKGKKK